MATSLSTSHLRQHPNDDMWIDRLCHRYSVVLFSLFAILVTSKTYIGNPIGSFFLVTLNLQTYYSTCVN